LVQYANDPNPAVRAIVRRADQEIGKAREDGYRRGFDAGYRDGHRSGYDDGHGDALSGGSGC